MRFVLPLRRSLLPLLAAAVLVLATPARGDAPAEPGADLAAGAEAAAPSWSLAATVAAAGLVVNDAWSARPDASGAAAARLTLRADLELGGGRFALAWEAAARSARERAARASAVDQIVEGALRLPGVDLVGRYESDVPVDRPGPRAWTADAQLRWNAPALDAPRLSGSAWLGAGAVVAGNLPSRPDGSGIAAVRCAAHAELRPLARWLVARLELVGLSPRGAPGALSEVDAIAAAGVELWGHEVGVVAERHAPVDRGGLRTGYVAVQVSRALGRWGG